MRYKLDEKVIFISTGEEVYIASVNPVTCDQSAGWYIMEHTESIGWNGQYAGDKSELYGYMPKGNHTYYYVNEEDLRALPITEIGKELHEAIIFCKQAKHRIENE